MVHNIWVFGAFVLDEDNRDLAFVNDFEEDADVGGGLDRDLAGLQHKSAELRLVELEERHVAGVVPFDRELGDVVDAQFRHGDGQAEPVVELVLNASALGESDPVLEVGVERGDELLLVAEQPEAHLQVDGVAARVDLREEQVALGDGNTAHEDVQAVHDLERWRDEALERVGGVAHGAATPHGGHEAAVQRRARALHAAGTGRRDRPAHGAAAVQERRAAGAGAGAAAGGRGGRAAARGGVGARAPRAGTAGSAGVAAARAGGRGGGRREGR